MSPSEQEYWDRWRRERRFAWAAFTFSAFAVVLNVVLLGMKYGWLG